jgi:hypothetical protein
MLPSSLRFTRLSLALIAALASLGGAAASAEAAPACGKKLCLELSPEPDTNLVIPNGNLIYRADVTVPAGGTSTATKATLTLELDPNVRLVTFDDRCTQPPADLITCDLGSVKPSDTPLTLRFFVRMPSGGTTHSVATLTSDARANDTGTDDGDPTPETVTEGQDVSVGVQQGHSASAVHRNEKITLDTDPSGTGATDQDVQTARFTILAKDFFTSAAVDDNVQDSAFECPSGFFCPGGGWVQAVIPGPAFDPFGPFIGDNSINLDIRDDASLIPRGLTTSNYVLIHDRDYNDPLHPLALEFITRSCKRNPPPCLNKVEKLRDGDFHINAQVTGNWRYR